MRKVAIITHSDYTWHFSLWARTLPVLARSYQISAIFLLPPRVGPKKGAGATSWYLRTFDLHDLLILFALALRQWLSCFVPRRKNWESLAAEHRCKLFRIHSPHGRDTEQWMKDNGIDIAFVTCDYIIRKPLIDAVTLGIINKHSSILPGCRGLYSYFWARLIGAPTGFSFHVVDEGIDTGPILVEQRYPDEGSYRGSLVRFYLDVFHLFPLFALTAAERLCRGEYLSPNSHIRSSYFGLPTKADVKKFKQLSPIVRWRDLFYRPEVSLPVEESMPIRPALKLKRS